ncbi:sirohydrochlorin cobaltochelatase [Desulfobulbus elongatus]|uniref:sirohydrochlorin cobaltochelatase n=1 Tax=Desulfobulbus elongatus TaxID=53332 RepID=UPI000AEABA00|nr:sirohydrochlorin cobaltochelatase [Desulfobulbus elongatus]
MWRNLMKKQWMILACAAVLLAGLQARWCVAAGHPAKEDKGPAILLVTFGTSVDSAQSAFRTVEQRVKAAFPKTEVRWAYTSKIIRKKLEKEGTHIDSPEVALARLMDDGYTKVAVQSLHMIPGAEFHELYDNARLFGQMSGGIDKVVVSSPLLVSDETMDKALKEVMARVVPKARQANEAVVLMGHGTHHPSDAIYSALMYKAQKMDPNVYVGTVEGSPSFDEIKEMLVQKNIKKAYLIPFMTVAGDHAMNDMAGDEPDSWKSQLTKAGIESVPVMKGLAEFDAIADMWVAQLKTAMAHLQ